MKYAMDVKVNVKPVFSNLVHSDWWEGPCRVGVREEGTPEFERRVGIQRELHRAGQRVRQAGPGRP